jgi:ethanolamine utilization protein, EutP
MKKIIFIGNIGCGKTTLCQAIRGEELEYKKTQAVEVIGDILFDTPGEYLERFQLRGALMNTSADADIIGLVLSATEVRDMLPPCYAGSFAKEAIGIVTKTDLATEKQIEIAVQRLKIAGAGKIFLTSSVTKAGISDLVNYLDDDEE